MSLGQEDCSNLFKLIISFLSRTPNPSGLDLLFCNLIPSHSLVEGHSYRATPNLAVSVYRGHWLPDILFNSLILRPINGHGIYLRSRV